MKTLFPTNPAGPRARSALTILEMLVSTAMLLFIVVGLTAVFIQTQKAFKTGLKQNTITDAGRAIMDMITGDLRQMSDARNTNYMTNYNFNFYWDFPTSGTMITNYINGVAIRTNVLNNFFILEHTNTTWIGVGYAVSNYPGVAVGSLYRYETNWTSLAPVFTNDLFSPFYTNVTSPSPSFSTNYWHKIADGIIDMEIRAFDQYGNENNYDPRFPLISFYPLGYNYYWFQLQAYGAPPSNTLPNSVELEFGILEPDTLVQARALAGNAGALTAFLSSNAAPHTEIFRQRVTVAAASR